MKKFVLIYLIFALSIQGFNSSNCDIGTVCSSYCCPSTLDTCASPSFGQICYKECPSELLCGESCCQYKESCTQEKAGKYCQMKVYPYVGGYLFFDYIDWVSITWYSLDNSTLKTNFTLQNNETDVISQFSTGDTATSNFSSYGSWGASTAQDMQLKLACQNLIEPCKIAYSVRGGVTGTPKTQ